jgi:hypothetical protein
LLGGRCGVADVDPLPIEEEAESLGSAVAQRERGRSLCSVLEPV